MKRAVATTQLSGSCLCGAVRFEVNGAFDAFYLCHCSRCRKDTGSAHAANLFARQAELRWTAGGDAVRTFNLHGTRHAKAFCSTCGSALPFVGEGFVVVPAGSLDGDAPRKAQAHLFAGCRASWDCELEQVPAFESLPK